MWWGIAVEEGLEFHAEAVVFGFEFVVGLLVELKEVGVLFGSRTGGFFEAVEDAETANLVEEVAAVEFHFEHLFVEVLKLANGESLGEEFEANGFEMDFATESFNGILEDSLVVESELRHFVDIEPTSLRSVVAAFYFARFHQCEESDGDNTFAGITFNGRISFELFDISVANAGLFKELTACTIFGGFVLSHETSGKSPRALERFYTALHKEYLQAISVVSEDDAVGGNCGMGILVSVVFV